MKKPNEQQISFAIGLTLLNIFAALSGQRELDNPWLWVVVLGLWPGLLLAVLWLDGIGEKK